MIKKEKHFEESETMNKGEKKYFKETAINIFRETKKKRYLIPESKIGNSSWD